MFFSFSLFISFAKLDETKRKVSYFAQIVARKSEMNRQENWCLIVPWPSMMLVRTEDVPFSYTVEAEGL